MATDCSSEAGGFIEGLVNGDVVTAAAAVGIGSLVLILLMQARLPKLPSVLVVVVLAIVTVNVFDLVEQGVSVVGPLQQGFPPFTIPDVSFADAVQLVPGALGIALVALVDTISTASAFAARSHERVRGNQEMIGIGAANVSAGLFQGFPVSTSGSRTAVAEQAGAKTQVTGFVGALAITCVVLLFPGLLRNLPNPTLAAVVIAAAFSLADCPERFGCSGNDGPSSGSASRRSSASRCSACFPASRSPSHSRSSTCSDACGGRIKRFSVA